MTLIPNSFDFTGNVQPVELEPIYWFGRSAFVPGVLPSASRELGRPFGHSDGSVCHRPTFTS